MENWEKTYRSRVMSVEEALRKIPEGAHIYASGAASEPETIVKAMYEHKDWFKGTTYFNILSIEDGPYCDPAMVGHVRYRSIFGSGPTRLAMNEDRADFLPDFYSELPEFIGGRWPIDVALFMVSKPNKFGCVSTGPTCDFLPKAIKSARLVIVQVNSNMPFALGDTIIPVEDIDCFVEADEPLPELPQPKIGDIEKKIGAYCASLIHDGDTLQLGIGGIPDAVLGCLGDKHDLGIHSEMISDGVMNLMKAGIITNKRKTLDPGVSVTTFMMGSRSLYEFVDNNPQVELRRVDYTNNPRVICQQDNMVAINSCIQVDLTGQVVAECFGPRQYSGTGGQVDFTRGANMSRGGKAIIAMPSTAAHGTLSRIVSALPMGAAVTTLRTDVNYVITEYGIAQLRGCTIDERVSALIAIAHPKFRDQLREEWNHRLDNQ